MNRPEANEVEKTLQNEDIHQNWESHYRTLENEKFYDIAFEQILKILDPPKHSKLLDAGCGPCNYSIRLAKSENLSVTAVDISQSTLKLAEINLRSKKLLGKIKLQRENILSLSFHDESFDYILCWGVLMHIPDLEKAISELSRVLKKGGILIISEANMDSAQCLLVRSLKLLLNKNKKTTSIRTEAGIEYWQETPNGKLMIRHTNSKWLINEFKSYGIKLKLCMAGQFTEFYTSVSSPLLTRLIHNFNHYWFKHIKNPHLAFGNIFILEKKI